MNIQIKNRWTCAVQFECAASAEVVGRSFDIRLGFAIKEAVKGRANLSGAVLSDADLRGANLSGAVLSDADLRGADLHGADLRGANLRDAELSDADLRGADLHGADLRGANLRDAELSDANLRGANLRGADLRGANLRGADLHGADLRGANLRDAELSRAVLSDAELSDANLRGAELRGAELSAFKQDMIAEILRLPNELEALRAAIVEGRIDGSTYSGECACLAGTLAKAHGIEAYSGNDIEIGALTFHADAYSPREQWFALIKMGDTPETNQPSRIALGWVDDAIAIRDMIRASAP